MNHVPKYLSVVIPVYNEEARLPKALKIIKQWHLQQPNWEFIVVNDGSTDRTENIIKLIKFIKLITYVKNQGKGYALKQGVLTARQPLILLCDIDFSTPLTELPKLYEKITTVDMVIGSRKTLGAKIVKHQPWWREFLGKQFTNLSKIILGLRVSDVTCGFKLMRNQTAKQLFNLSRINRWGYDAEILYIAKLKNISVADVPVMWENDERTKVSIFKDIFLSLKELGLIKINYWLGKYDKKLNIVNKKNIWILSLIIFLGVILRFWHLGYADFLPDETHYAYESFQVFKKNPGMVCRFHTQFHPLRQLGHPCLNLYLTSLSYKIFTPSVFSARFISAFLGVLTLPLIFLITNSLLKSSAGLLAALSYAIFPLAVRFDKTTYLDSVKTFMVAAFLGVYLKFKNSTNYFYSVFLGIILALLLLTKLSAPLIFIFLLGEFIVGLRKNLKACLKKYLLMFLAFCPVFVIGTNPQAYILGILQPTDQDFSVKHISFSFMKSFQSITDQSIIALIPFLFIVLMILGIVHYIKNKKPLFLIIYFLTWLPLAGLTLIGFSNIYRLLPLMMIGSIFVGYYLSLLKPRWKVLATTTLILWSSLASFKWALIEINKITPIDLTTMNYLNEINLGNSRKIYLYDRPGNYFFWEDKINFIYGQDWIKVIENENFDCVVSNDNINEAKELNQTLIKNKGFFVKKSFQNSEKSFLILCKIN